MPKITTEIAMASGREISPHPQMRSALDRNFNAAASSTNPRTTFPVFIHEPDFGRRFSVLGNRAKKMNGSENVALKTTIPATGYAHSLLAVAASSPPTNGAVHEKETSVSVSPMNNTPRYPLRSLL